MFTRQLYVGLLVSTVLLSNCGSTKEAVTLTAEDLFLKAKELFDDGNYLEAINQFTVITLQYQGSSRAAEAQYYLGECRFKRGEFLLAIYEYSTLRRNMPASPLVADAQYKIGMCYYNLSPKVSLDQQYTKKAIDEFQTFVEYYPSNPLAVEADAKIKELTNRLAEKAYQTAQLYTTLEYYKAAQFYYDDVIEKYHDTQYAPLAYLGKVQVLMARKHYQEALVEINRFIERFPDSVLRHKADQLKESVESELKSSKQVTGKGSGSRDNGTPLTKSYTRLQKSR
jgi:outer membrane protein assembly factor BamD